MKLTISRTFRDSLIDAEYAAWEDLGMPDEVPDMGDLEYGHAVPILRRWKTRLELRDEREAGLLLECLEYWGRASGVVWSTPQFRAACERMWSRIKDATRKEAT